MAFKKKSEMGTSRLAAMAAMAELMATAELWLPEHGPIGGYVLNRQTIGSAYGEAEQLLVEKEDGSVVRVGMFGVVLAQACLRNNISTGDLVFILPGEKVGNKAGTQEYTDFTVIVDHGEADTEEATN